MSVAAGEYKIISGNAEAVAREVTQILQDKTSGTLAWVLYGPLVVTRASVSLVYTQALVVSKRELTAFEKEKLSHATRWER